MPHLLKQAILYIGHTNPPLCVLNPIVQRPAGFAIRRKTSGLRLISMEQYNRERLLALGTVFLINHVFALSADAQDTPESPEGFHRATSGDVGGPGRAERHASNAGAVPNGQRWVQLDFEGLMYSCSYHDTEWLQSKRNRV